MKLGLNLEKVILFVENEEKIKKNIKIDTALSKKVPGFVQILENYNITKFCQQKTVSNQNVWRKLR